MTDTKKRVVLTPAERVAKAKAELAELEAKAAAKVKARAAALREQRAKLVTKRDETDAKIQEIDNELMELEVLDAEDEGDVELPLEEELPRGNNVTSIGNGTDG